MNEDPDDNERPPEHLVKPSARVVPGDDTRAAWLHQVEREFVNPSKANKSYYVAILECLWPKGHGLPGPHRTEDEIRQAIDDRRSTGGHGRSRKSYKDPFRRVRELQGEEGIFGLIHDGRKLQLAHNTVGRKRPPRTGLSNTDWQKVLNRDGHACTVCNRSEEDVDLQQDHRVPRVRRGSDELSNWQPLCTECNNFKSTACRGCGEDCQRCSWAFPEKFGPIRLSGSNIVAARLLAKRRDTDVHALVNELLTESLRGQK